MIKRSKANGLVMRSKPGIWPPPVYHAVFMRDGVKTIHRRSFYSQDGKPIDASRVREWLGKSRFVPRDSELVHGYICHNGTVTQDFPVTSHVKATAKRISAKQAREQLGKLLACLDGSVTDREEIRGIVTECRKIAA